MRRDSFSVTSAVPTSGNLNIAELAEKTRMMLQPRDNSTRILRKLSDAEQSNLDQSKCTEALPFEGIGGGLSRGRSGKHLMMDNLFDNVETVENLFHQSEVMMPEEIEMENREKDKRNDDDEETGPNVITPLLGGAQRQKKIDCRPNRTYRICQSFRYILDPGFVMRSLIEFLIFRVLLVMVPCLSIAGILFYKLGNPVVDFLPLQASISWWLIFFVRQLVTLQIAHCSQYVFVDMLALRSIVSVKVFGPLLTLFVIQAKGWPFVVTFWGLWNLLLIHGGQPFQKNWLFFTDIRMFSSENTDDGVLQHELYLRILLSMVIAGAAVTIKRTYMAYYFGKRTFFHFKQQLGSLVTTIFLLTEIADLAEELEGTNIVSILPQREDGSFFLDIGRKPTKSADRWIMDMVDRSTPTGELFSDSNDDKSESSSDEDSKTSRDERLDFKKSKERPSLVRSRGTMKPSGGIKDSLENWQEPMNILDGANDPSIHDILQFRKILSYMDETYPFGASFGAAESRDSCIESSQALYKRLLNLAPGHDTLPFDAIKVVAFDEQGQLNEEKVQMLGRLFRPNKFDKLTMLAFVQTCDGVYKKLRYFRASVANASLIDKVLEQIFNTIFYFILLLVLLAVLNFNPWTLLVSMSTMVVSFAFALGPSVSKLIEGILLIAVRRPYDLGDRLIITHAEFVGKVAPGDSWFVENVTLTTTTLRFAGTNEVASINNGSIANARLINTTRSPNALVALDLRFGITVTHENIAAFRSEVEKYVKDNPRRWVKIVFLGINCIDPSINLVEYSLRLQHVKGWQDIGAINLNKGELFKFCTDFMTKQGTVYFPRHKEVDVYVDKNIDEKVNIQAVNA
mmetsp:Transcript_2475/g.3328  ORF Transcript_2475/g.3328 Transcript_2475/m.3328 type:complete len:853 (-) Transcript_2475:193-2751(-)